MPAATWRVMTSAVVASTADRSSSGATSSPRLRRPCSAASSVGRGGLAAGVTTERAPVGRTAASDDTGVRQAGQLAGGSQLGEGRHGIGVAEEPLDAVVGVAPGGVE